VAAETQKQLARRVPRPAGLCPEQVVSGAGEGEGETDAVLIDAWGREHELREVSLLGRDPEKATVAVLEASVSRHHAELRWTTEGWTLVDLGSTNGTFLEGKRVAHVSAVRDRQIVCVGDVGFVFVADRTSLAGCGVTDSIRATAGARRGGKARLIEADGGGVLEHAGVQVVLGSTQLALLRLLAARQRDGDDEAVRGFVRSIELITSLPWDTAHPEDNHVKQLVRRVRKALEKVGLGAAIESRHGFGYRLTIGLDDG
jgi:hypothetical protein